MGMKQQIAPPAAAAPAERTQSGRIPSLDGLRAISICAVLLGHAAAHFPVSLFKMRAVRSVLAMSSYLGVTVFFVISGYLITILLLKEQDRESRIDLKRFFLRRAVRILPASMVYIAVVLVVGNATVFQSMLALTFTTTYFFDAAYRPLQHLWSLSVEEQFYLLWPLVFATGIPVARRYCWVILALSPLVRLLLLHLKLGPDTYSHCAPAIADSLAAGCLLAFYQDRCRHLVNRYLASGWAPLSLSLLTLAISIALYRFNLVLLWGIIPCLIAVTTCASVERRYFILNSRPLVWIGMLSYSLYLWQQPFLSLNGPLHYLSVRLFLTFAFACASYRLIEQPMLRFRPPHRKRASSPNTVLALADPA
jgi:peptidoglycan/LPS O-acetylase OafA/YrhL